MPLCLYLMFRDGVRQSGQGNLENDGKMGEFIFSRWMNSLTLDEGSQPEALIWLCGEPDLEMCVYVYIRYTNDTCDLLCSCTEDEDGLSLKDNSHNSSFELTSSTLPSYQPVSRAAGKGLSTAVFRSPSPCFFRPSFLGSASKVGLFQQENNFLLFLKALGVVQNLVLIMGKNTKFYLECCFGDFLVFGIIIYKLFYCLSKILFWVLVW